MEVARVEATRRRTRRRRPRARDFLVLAKLRITFLVVVTAAVGYALAPGGFDAAVFFALIIGTASFPRGVGPEPGLGTRHGREDGTDAKSPSPRGAHHSPRRHRLRSGAVRLRAGAPRRRAPARRALGLLAAVSYVLAYTPLKRRSSLCTIVGAIPGALPPMMGWAAGRGSLARRVGALHTVFLWQLPHFLAIGWIYREDYARAGLPMLTVTDPDGTSTGRQMVLYSAALLPATLFAGALFSAGPAYLGSAVCSGSSSWRALALRAGEDGFRGALALSGLRALSSAPLGMMVFGR